MHYRPLYSCTLGNYAVSKITKIVNQRNIQKSSTDKETWPPFQPKLVLIHHQGHRTRKQAISARLIQTGDIVRTASLPSNQLVSNHHPKLNSHKLLKEVHDSGTVTKELTEVLAMLEQSNDPPYILIEGAPGIGKLVLLKDIAYRWGNKQMLKTFTLVLLICLRDPIVQQVVSLSDLFQHFCEGSRKSIELGTQSHTVIIFLAKILSSSLMVLMSYQLNYKRIIYCLKS